MTLLRALFAAFLLTLPAFADTQPPMIAEGQRDQWAAVGRVNIGGFRSSGLCTGVLIAPKLVLTAAHCVIDPVTAKPFAIYRVKFVAAWHKGEHKGAGSARDVYVHADYKPALTTSDRTIKPENVGVDIAVIELAEDLGITPLDVATPTPPAQTVAVLGYRKDRPHVLSDYPDCGAALASYTVLALTCPVTQGTSGAPVFQLIDGVWQIVGVVSAQRKGKGPYKALAARVDTKVLGGFLDGLD